MTKPNLRGLFEASGKILVIGMSKDALKPSNFVSVYLASHNFEIVGINPTTTSGFICNFPVYPDIDSLPAGFFPDILVIFRPSAEAEGIVRICLGKNLPKKAVWLQLGITSAASKKLVKEKGLVFVENKCIMQEYRKQKNQ